jgi:hypothetical protein
MSWRDRLARQDPANASVVSAESANSSSTKAIGANGTISNGIFSAEIVLVNAIPGKTGEPAKGSPAPGKASASKVF